MLQKSGPFCHELNYFYISALQSYQIDWVKVWSTFDSGFTFFLVCTCLSALQVLGSQTKLVSTCNSWVQINFHFLKSGFPINRGQSSEVRGCDTSLRSGLYCHINGMGVRRELGLTRSRVSELITTSLWAKNSKGFLAYHCFNYRGGEESRHTAVWLHGRKQLCLRRNYAGCLWWILCTVVHYCGHWVV